MANIVSFADVVMFHHHSWKLDGEAGGRQMLTDVVMFHHHGWKLDSEAGGWADACQCGHVSSS